MYIGVCGLIFLFFLFTFKNCMFALNFLNCLFVYEFSFSFVINISLIAAFFGSFFSGI